MMQQQGAQKVLLSIVPPVTCLLVTNNKVYMSLYLPARLQEPLALYIPISHFLWVYIPQLHSARVPVHNHSHTCHAL